MIELRRVESATDADVFLDIRRQIDPEHVPSRAAYLEHIRSPGRLDLLAYVEAEPVAAGFVEPHGDDRNGPEAWASVRVLPGSRRRGVGTALFRALSERARSDGRTALTMPVRPDDSDGFSYLSKRGFVEAIRMRESFLALDHEPVPIAPPAGVEIAALTPALERRVFAAAIEIAGDIPAADGVRVGTFAEWRDHQLSSQLLPDCTFAALDGAEVAGFAILHDGGDGVGLHAMTAVRSAWRRRGIALALKRAQIEAARAAGLRTLRTANAVQNPMLAVNERLGFRRDLDWIHLRGQLLDGEGR
jgi:mycothiol synthase